MNDRAELYAKHPSYNEYRRLLVLTKGICEGGGTSGKCQGEQQKPTHTQAKTHELA
jgi:hypothetical protein